MCEFLYKGILFFTAMLENLEKHEHYQSKWFLKRTNNDDPWSQWHENYHLIHSLDAASVLYVSSCGVIRKCVPEILTFITDFSVKSNRKQGQCIRFIYFNFICSNPVFIFNWWNHFLYDKFERLNSIFADFKSILDL